MKIQILILVSIVILSKGVFAESCNSDNLLGTWLTEYKSDVYIHTVKQTYSLENGELVGVGIRRIQYPVSPDSTINFKMELLSEGVLKYTLDFGRVYPMVPCAINGSNMTVGNEAMGIEVYKKISGPDSPPNSANPSTPDVCYNCSLIVNPDPKVSYPPTSASISCTEKNLQGTWKETKDYSDSDGYGCTYKHKTVEEIVFNMKGKDPSTSAPILDGTGYMKGEHTLLNKDDGSECKTIKVDLEYTKISFSPSNYVLSIDNIGRPNPNYPDTPNSTFPGSNMYVDCQIYDGGKTLVFDQGRTRRRLTRQSNKIQIISFKSKFQQKKLKVLKKN